MKVLCATRAEFTEWNLIERLHGVTMCILLSVDPLPAPWQVRILAVVMYLSWRVSLQHHGRRSHCFQLINLPTTDNSLKHQSLKVLHAYLINYWVYRYGNEEYSLYPALLICVSTPRNAMSLEAIFCPARDRPYQVAHLLLVADHKRWWCGKRN